MRKALQMPRKKSTKVKPKTNDSHTEITYLDPGKGYVTRRCFYCDGSGRVYEGGYGLRDCGACS